MSDHMKKVKPGDRLRMPAPTITTFVCAAQDFRGDGCQAFGWSRADYRTGLGKTAARCPVLRPKTVTATAVAG